MAIEPGLKVPTARRGSDQIHAGSVQIQAGKRQFARQQAGQANSRAHGFDVGKRFDASRGIVGDHHAFDGESGSAEKVQVHVADLYGTVQGRFERRLDARPEAVRTEPRRDEPGGQNQHDEGKNRTA